MNNTTISSYQVVRYLIAVVAMLTRSFTSLAGSFAMAKTFGVQGLTELSGRAYRKTGEMEMNRQHTLASKAKWALPLSLMLSVSAYADGAFRVQCPASTPLHPLVNAAGVVDANPKNNKFPNPNIKCQEVAGTDGYATMADGNQIYLFGFGALSGQDQIHHGLPGTQTAADFNKAYNSPTFFFGPPDPGALDPSQPSAATVVADPLYYTGLPTNTNAGVTDPSQIMNVGVLAANQPAPLMAIDEDDEFFLTLSNVGMIMRPDLFEQHTVHFHGYPNAAPIFDGVPDASVAIGIAGSMSYYYTAPDAGTYFWHCHITPPEHLQMGMVGQLYVRPRQNRVPASASLYNALMASNNANLTQVHDTTSANGSCSDILCTGATPLPKDTTAIQPVGGAKYAYNDGDGSTRYDVEYPIQMMGFDPNFHFVGMTFNPEDFAGMKDKYFLLNGRGYPDTVQNATPQYTQGSDGMSRPSQPISALITIDKTNLKQTRALLRISQLSLTESVTLATVGVQMKVIGHDARLLRDLDGNDLTYTTNSISLMGGESADVILDVTDVPPGTYFLYSTNLDHLSNDAENFGGMMTEIHVI